MTCWDQQLLAGEPADAGIAKCSSLLPQTSRILPCVAMGSMPEGTLCVYCGVHEAGYIIDGCCGPMCLGFPGSCWTLCETNGVDFVVNKRLTRLWSARMRMVSVNINGAHDRVFNDAELGLCISSFLYRT